MNNIDDLAEEFLMTMDSALWTNPPKNMVPIFVIRDFVKFLKENTVNDSTDRD
jgi:hypothetical protein